MAEQKIKQIGIDIGGNIRRIRLEKVMVKLNLSECCNCKTWTSPGKRLSKSNAESSILPDPSSEE